MYNGAGQGPQGRCTPRPGCADGDRRADGSCRRTGAPPEALIERFQELTASLERIEDPLARRSAEELIGVVLDLYGEGLRRIFDGLVEEGEATAELREPARRRRRRGEPDADPRPLPGLARGAGAGGARRASAPTWSPTAATSSWSGIEEGTARIRLAGSCDGCPASSATLELAIKQALDEHAPDLEALEVEGGIGRAAGSTPPRAASSCRSSRSPRTATSLRRRTATAPAAVGDGLPSWFALDGVAQLEDGELDRRPRRRGRRSSSPTSTAPCSPTGRAAPTARPPLGGAALIEGVLACTSCGRRYYLPRAGRSLDDDKLQLEPVPLLREGGAVRVALAT